MLEDVVKQKSLSFFKFLSLSAECVRESGFINMKQMVEYHPLISVTIVMIILQII